MKIGKVWLIGSLLTLAIVWLLIKSGHPKSAIATIVVSPFPCPPGLPC